MNKPNLVNSSKKKSSKFQIAKKLLITTICSILLIFGSLTALKAILTGAGFAGMSGPSANDEAEQIRLSRIALTLLIGSPIALSIYFRPAIRGLLAGVLAIFAAILSWRLAGTLYESNALQSTFPGIMKGLSLHSVIVASAMITTILIATGRVRSRREFSGLGLGLLVGLILSLLTSAFIASEIVVFSSGIIFIWVSSVYFTERFRMLQN